MAKEISRKQALKQLGTLALGSMVLPRMLFANTPKEISFPHIIKHIPGKKPNILYIIMEGVPVSMIGCYGNYRIHNNTPNIDRIAREGMKLDNACVTNALCAPSRATNLTGTYSNVNGKLTNDMRHPFNGNQITYPQVLKDHGYKTGFVGKWHLVSNPVGFDYWKIRHGAGGPYYNPTYFEKPEGGGKGAVKRTYKGYATDVSTDMVINGIKKLKEPFCMVFSPVAVHSHFEPPVKYKYQHIFDSERIVEPGTFWDEYMHRSAAAKEAHMRIEDMANKQFYGHVAETRPKNLTDRQRKQWNYQSFIKNFNGTLKSVDDNIGRLTQYLDNAGLSDNTIIIVTSDHGFFMGEHGWFDKRFMYEEAIRVPWIIRYPGHIKPGTINNALALNIDNAPTVIDLAGIHVPGEMQGVSLRPLFGGSKPSGWRDSMYYHYYEFAPPHFVMPHYGIRTDRYSLINYYTINEWELFDRLRDPDEMESLFKMGGYQTNSEYKDIAPKLIGQLKKLRHEYKDTTGKPVKFFPFKVYD